MSLREGRAVLTARGFLLEPDRVGLAVEQHRWAWKPSHVPDHIDEQCGPRFPSGA
jgi:hypothetical protein